MLSPKQKRLVGFSRRAGLLLLAVGTIRSGKTYSAAAGFALHLLSLREPHKHLVLGRKLRVMEQEILPTIRKVCDGLGAVYEYSRYDHSLKIGSQEALVAAGNDEKSSDMVRGLTRHSALIDECTEVPKNFWDMGISRLSYPGSKCFATCNPSTPLHWLKTEWIDQGRVDEYMEFEFEDNPTLSREVVERYKSLFTGVFAKRMIQGVWCASEGLVYPDPEVRRIALEAWKVVRADIGVDYGTASTSVALPMLLLARERKRLLYVPGSEMLEGGPTRRNPTDDEIADMVHAQAAAHKARSAVIDPQAASLKAVLRRKKKRGYAVRNAYNDLLPGISMTSAAMARGDLVISPDAVPLIEELQSYGWDPDKVDTPVKEHDHHCDALRYAATLHLKRISMTRPLLLKGGGL